MLIRLRSFRIALHVVITHCEGTQAMPCYGHEPVFPIAMVLHRWCHTTYWCKKRQVLRSSSLRASLSRCNPWATPIASGDMWGYFNGFPTHFQPIHFLVRAYVRVLLRYKPLQHHKHQHQSWHLRHPITLHHWVVRWGRIARDPICLPPHIRADSAALLRTACQPWPCLWVYFMPIRVVWTPELLVYWLWIELWIHVQQSLDLLHPMSFCF